jgi:hypothetical protein
MLPSFGSHAVSSVKLDAVNNEIAAATIMESKKADPARPAAIPVTTNIPPPIIAPTPIAVASNRPSEGLNPDC